MTTHGIKAWILRQRKAYGNHAEMVAKHHTDRCTRRSGAQRSRTRTINQKMRGRHKLYPSAAKIRSEDHDLENEITQLDTA